MFWLLEHLPPRNALGNNVKPEKYHAQPKINSDWYQLKIVISYSISGIALSKTVSFHVEMITLERIDVPTIYSHLNATFQNSDFPFFFENSFRKFPKRFGT